MTVTPHCPFEPNTWEGLPPPPSVADQQFLHPWFPRRGRDSPTSQSLPSSQVLPQRHTKISHNVWRNSITLEISLLDQGVAEGTNQRSALDWDMIKCHFTSNMAACIAVTKLA